MLIAFHGFDDGGAFDSGWNYNSYNQGYDGRQYGGSLRVTSNSYARAMTNITTVTGDTTVLGVAIKVDSMIHTTTMITTLINTEGYSLSMDNLGHLVLRNLTNSSALSVQSTSSLEVGLWYYVEIKFKLHLTDGVAQVRVNGSTWIDFTGRTQSGSLTGANMLTQLYLGYPGSNVSYDDMYLLDSSGSSHNDYLGDCRVSTLNPDGNGSVSQWIGSDGNQVNNYQMVYDYGAGYGDYVQSDQVGNEDLYAIANLPANNAVILALRIVGSLAKTDTGNRGAAFVTKSGANRLEQIYGSLQTDVKVWAAPIQTTLPGGAPLTLTEVNALEIGVKVTS